MSITISEITINDTRLSGNPIWVKCTASGIPAGASGYKILLKAESVDGELVGSPFSPDAIPPDGNNEALFDLSGLVDQDVEKDFRWPLDGKSHGYPALVYDIMLYAGEQYIDSDGELQENYESVFQPVFIVKGKIPEYLLKKLNAASSDWYTWFATGGRFLSLMPLQQMVAPYQPVKLWIKGNNPSAAAYSFTCYVKGYFDDGTDQTINFSADIYRDMLHEFDVQPENIGFTLDDGSKKLIKYEVWGSGNSVTYEHRIFHIDWSHQEKYYYLLVDNQVGGIECIWLSGRVKYNPTGEKNIAVEPLPKGAGVKISTRKISGNSRRRQWTINTGIKSTPGEMPGLDILLDAPAAWLAVPPADGSTALTNYEIIPVIVESDELNLYDDLNYGLDNVDLRLTEAH